MNCESQRILDKQIQYNGKTISGTITVPGSKSIAIRLLLIRYLSRSEASISGLPDNDDTRIMETLLTLISSLKDTDNKEPYIIDCQHTGTVFRLLTSLLSITPGNWLLTGSERMQQRPVGSLVEALRTLGAEITYTGKPGFPPLHIHGKKLPGGKAELNSDESSQYISSLLMISPLFAHGLVLDITGKRVSEPYISLTVSLMEQSGIKVIRQAEGFRVESGEYRFMPVTVESDWSSASCWYETMALSGNGKINIKGLISNSLQGDRILSAVYGKLGVITRFTEEGVTLTKSSDLPAELHFDLKDHPDIVPSLAVTMAGMQIKGSISGIEHLRIKESDRIFSIYQELQKAGFEVEIIDNKLLFTGIKKPGSPDVIFSSHNDHRIAMALAPLALKINDLTLSGTEATAKSYPGFWADLQTIGFEVFSK